MGLAGEKAAFARLGVRVYALSLEPVDELRDLQEKLGDGVTLLSDPSGQAAEAFDALDPDPFPNKVMARAATFHVDREGKIRRRWLTESYRDRPEAAASGGALAR